jgi:hypothetical protein
MLLPMAILTAACIAVGMMPGLLLVPIAAIQQNLGMAPIATTWGGPLPSAGGWHPGVLSVLLLLLAGVAMLYLRLGRAGKPVVRSPIHLCGVADIAPAMAHVGASNLFESPDAAMRGLLHASYDTGYSEDEPEAHAHAAPVETKKD